MKKFDNLKMMRTEVGCPGQDNYKMPTWRALKVRKRIVQHHHRRRTANNVRNPSGTRLRLLNAFDELRAQHTIESIETAAASSSSPQPPSFCASPPLLRAHFTSLSN